MSLHTDLIGQKVSVSWIRGGNHNNRDGIVRCVYVARREDRVPRFIVEFDCGELMDIGCDSCRVKQ